MSEAVQVAEHGEAPAWERVFAVAILVLLTGAFMNLFLSPEQQLDPGEGLAGIRYVWAAIYAGVLAIWWRTGTERRGLLFERKAIVALVALALASAAWSDSPATTMRRGFALVGTSMMALYFASRFKLREQLQILAGAFGACVAFSFLFGFLHLGRSVDYMEGVWYGIYTQRNALGTVMVFATLVFLLWGRVRPERRWMAGSLTALAFILILLSGSVTSLVAFCVVLLSFPMVSLIRRFEQSGRFLILCSVILIAAAWWAGSAFDAVTEAMGRDSSLTGRTELWGASLLFGLDRPLLGYGYNAFWLGLDGPSADIWKIVGWAAPNAHNGLLEIWLDLGIVGVGIAAIGFGSYLREAFRLVHETARWEYAWPLLFLVTLLTLNLTETAFFQGNSIYWFLYVVAALDLSLMQRQRMIRARDATPEAKT